MKAFPVNFAMFNFESLQLDWLLHLAQTNTSAHVPVEIILFLPLAWVSVNRTKQQASSFWCFFDFETKRVRLFVFNRFFAIETDDFVQRRRFESVFFDRHAVAATVVFAISVEQAS